MSKCLMDRCHDPRLEDTDPLPSIKVIRFRFLYGWFAANRPREEVIARVFRQKPGTQLFFFRKTSPSALKLPGGPPVFRQKPGTQFFFFRKTSLSTRKSSRPAQLRLIDIVCSKILVQALDSLDIAMGGVSQFALR